MNNLLNQFDLMSGTHVCYLMIGIAITIWVARTLRVRGTVFLIRGCKGDDEVAGSLSHLLSVGFYLVHIGFVLLALKLGGYARDTVAAIELLSTKIGLVMVVLGMSHFFHIALYARIHGKPRGKVRPGEPPITAQAVN